jgi:hypothetical protein
MSCPSIHSQRSAKCIDRPGFVAWHTDKHVIVRLFLNFAEAQALSDSIRAKLLCSLDENEFVRKSRNGMLRGESVDRCRAFPCSQDGHGIPIHCCLA